MRKIDNFPVYHFNFELKYPFTFEMVENSNIVQLPSLPTQTVSQRGFSIISQYCFGMTSGPTVTMETTYDFCRPSIISGRLCEVQLSQVNYEPSLQRVLQWKMIRPA
jgi:hypothetical protein